MRLVDGDELHDCIMDNDIHNGITASYWHQPVRAGRTQPAAGDHAKCSTVGVCAAVCVRRELEAADVGGVL